MTGDSAADASAPASAQPVVTHLPPAIGAALSISAAARQTGITVATLRMWQTRYGLGPSLTTSGGHRRYTAGDIQRLQRVTLLLSEGLTTGEAVHAVLAASRSTLGLPPDADPAAQHLAAAALKLDGPTARRLVREHLGAATSTRPGRTVLRPVLGAIGDHLSRVRHGIASGTPALPRGRRAAGPPSRLPTRAPNNTRGPPGRATARARRAACARANCTNSP